MSNKAPEKLASVVGEPQPDDRSKFFLALDIPLDLAAMLSSDHPVRSASTGQIAQLDLAVSQIVAVACPLISNQSDATVVIEDLEAIGYKGVLMVIAPPLPNPEMIATELRRQAHRLRVIMINP